MAGVAEPTRSSSRVLAGQVLAARLFAAVRQGWGTLESQSVAHFALSRMPHLFNMFRQNPEYLIGHFCFSGSSVEFYLCIFQITGSIPFSPDQWRQVFVAERRLLQRCWKPMSGTSDARMQGSQWNWKSCETFEMMI